MKSQSILPIASLLVLLLAITTAPNASAQSSNPSVPTVVPAKVLPSCPSPAASRQRTSSESQLSAKPDSQPLPHDSEVKQIPANTSTRQLTAAEIEELKDGK